MKLLFLGILLFSKVASAAEKVNDPLRDTVAPESQLKAIQGHVDASLSRAIAETLKNEPLSPQSYQRAIAFRSNNIAIMTEAFIEARVPDCLHSEGLKRQSTFFLKGVLALPFIAVAKVRGKCI